MSDLVKNLNYILGSQITNESILRAYKSILKVEELLEDDEFNNIEKLYSEYREQFLNNPRSKETVIAKNNFKEYYNNVIRLYKSDPKNINSEIHNDLVKYFNKDNYTTKYNKRRDNEYYFPHKSYISKSLSIGIDLSEAYTLNLPNDIRTFG